MKNRKPLKLRWPKIIWNTGLSVFSSIGFCITMWELLFGASTGVFTVGFYDSMCAPGHSWGCGVGGFWVMLFVYSKCFELIDTFFLLVGKKEVILLHWYHHVSVLMFCWYAYALRSSIGLYFCVVNYFVHSIMYGYYAMSTIGPYTRKIVRPYAFYITLIQLSQMVFGLAIVASNVYYKYHRYECHTFPNVNLFALIMYFSYFCLFLELFLNRYMFVKKKIIKNEKD
eukprot:UN24580